jgi:hypothetical protein
MLPLTVGETAADFHGVPCARYGQPVFRVDRDSKEYIILTAVVNSGRFCA